MLKNGMIRLTDLKGVDVTFEKTIEVILGKTMDIMNINIHSDKYLFNPNNLWLDLDPRVVRTNMNNDLSIRHINVGERKGKKVVCVVFKDGTHIIKECQKENEFDVNVGVALCLMERMCSSNNKFHKLVKSKLTDKSKELLEKWKQDDKARTTSKRSTK